jgi:hypothetical protein
MFRAFALAAFLITTVVGCASHQSPVVRTSTTEATLASTTVPATALVVPERRPMPAVALAFDPPVPAPEVAIDLSRSERQPQAFLGYDEGVVEFFSIRTDDRQYGSLGIHSGGSGYGGYGSGSSDNFEREAISVKSGVRYH